MFYHFAVQLNTIKGALQGARPEVRGWLGYCTNLHLFESFLEPHTITQSSNLYVL